MRSSIKLGAVVSSAAVILALSVAPAHAVDNKDVSAAVTAGGLSTTLSGASLSSVVLDGVSAKHATGAASSVWTITDARGSGAAWGLSVLGTDFTSAVGDTDLTPRTLPIGNLEITPGTVTASGGADAAPVGSTVTMSNQAQVLLSSAGGAKGSYTFTPSFDLTVPANAFRSNFATGASGAVNPYVSTITFTIA